MFGRSKIDRAKNAHPIDQLIESYGIQLKKKGNALMGKCPFHDDSTPSLSVSPEKGLWNCFGCNAGGDAITWVEKIEGCDRKTAIDRLAGEEFNPVKTVPSKPKPSPDEAFMPPVEKMIPAEPPKTKAEEQAPPVPDKNEEPAKPEPKSHTRIELLQEVARVFHDDFKTNKAAQRYLQGRGLNDKQLIEHFQVGYCNGATIKKMLPESGAMVDALRELGIINEKGNSSFYNMVVFPIADANGVIHSLYGRSIEGSRHHYTKGSRGAVWNGSIIKGHSTVIVTESIIDAYSLIEMGYPNTIPVYGTNGFTADHMKLLENHAVKEVVLCLDNDAPAEQAIETILKKLKPLKINVSRLNLPTGIKDPNEFRSNGAEKADFQKLFDSRVSLTKKPTAANNDDAKGGLLSHNGNTATFMLGNIHYFVKGFKTKNNDTMRVIVTAEHTKSKNTHTDRIDLYTARNRKFFAGACAQKLELQGARVEEDLLRIVGDIDSIRQKEKAKQEEKAAQYEMTEDERIEAIAFLKRKDLVGSVVRDLEVCGYVGEDSAKLLCYFSAISRITDDPISVTVRALSSSGKSYLLQIVAKLVPPEDVRFFSRLSQQSLFYMEQYELKHKIVIIDEKEGSANDYSLRTLLSTGKLVLGVVTRDPETGKSSTQTIEMEGPIVAWDSTTASEINQENLSRVFEVWLHSGSKELTKAIQDYQRRSYSVEGWKVDSDRDRVIRVHRNAQRLLRPLKVNIPFHEKLSFPIAWTTTRRHNKRFLSLLSAIALTHQYQREVKTFEGIEYIDATIEDYRIAYDLTRDIFAMTLNPLSKESQDLLSMMLTFVGNEAAKENVELTDFVFTRRQIREFAGWMETKTRNCFSELLGMEYIAKISGSQGSMYRYQLLVTELVDKDDAVAGLTHPNDL